MANSYPRRDQARGIWKINDITKNIKEDGTYPSGATRAVFSGGETPSIVNTMDFVTIETTGNATDFGDLVSAVSVPANGATSSFVRGIVAGGQPSYVTKIDYFHFASLGNCADFGDLTVGGAHMAGMSNNIRAVFGPRRKSGDGPDPTLDFITIATLGNATDFGDTTAARRNGPGASNNTRGLILGGEEAPGAVNKIEFIEFSTAANAVDFGDLVAVLIDSGAAANNTRACVMGGSNPSVTNQVQSVEIGTLGNAVDYGDLTQSATSVTGSGNKNRMVRAGGFVSPSQVNVIDFASFSQRSNFTDFGDLTASRASFTSTSNQHGGLVSFDPRAPELYSPTGKPFGGGGGVGDIGIMAGGADPNYNASMTFVQISTIGNAQDFGDASGVFGNSAGASGKTRFVMHLGDTSPGPLVNTVEYVEFQTKGNAADFGDLTQARRLDGSVCNDNRAVFGGGKTPTLQNTIDYITIGTLGNGSDFGDLQSATQGASQMINSTTRGLFAGGRRDPGAAYSDTTGYITIASTSNTTDFGNLSVARQYASAASSSTRGVAMGGETPGSAPGGVNTMDYFTIASTGNALDFGDLTVARRAGFGMSNSSRGLLAGGSTPSESNVIDYITIASTSNSTDFGDLITARSFGSPGSNGHGGLS